MAAKAGIQEQLIPMNSSSTLGKRYDVNSKFETRRKIRLEIYLKRAMGLTEWSSLLLLRARRR